MIQRGKKEKVNGSSHDFLFAVSATITYFESISSCTNSKQAITVSEEIEWTSEKVKVGKTPLTKSIDVENLSIYLPLGLEKFLKGSIKVRIFLLLNILEFLFSIEFSWEEFTYFVFILHGM